ncbi:hypothetical protein BD311DRAFT_245931 [Dichomitus squalens]|uniref:Uncharacterized protein n=1 Tax=Dichomitus squalens TaxID=114155 RepID=A0A4Q9MQ70_9APHY|nr:hypothetical protein BD311DRAFT_245931 [Dichomitus squalens]
MPISRGHHWDKQFAQYVPRAPFASSHGWLSARFALVQVNATDTSHSSNDDDDLESAAVRKRGVRGSRSCSRLSPLAAGDSPQSPREHSVIHQDDIWSLNVYSHGTLSNIVDRPPFPFKKGVSSPCEYTACARCAATARGARDERRRIPQRMFWSIT